MQGCRPACAEEEVVGQRSALAEAQNVSSFFLAKGTCPKGSANGAGAGKWE